MFVGCEGESEQGYAALLARLIDEARLAVHLDAVLLQPGGGDPLAIVERAATRADEREGRRGDPYVRRFVILDDDKLDQTPQRDQRIAGVAANSGLHLIWQSPCHEAVLLRHLEGCAQLRPPSTAIAGQQLVARWPGYQKAMPAVRLAERLDRAAVTRAATVEAELSVLLQEIGLI
ncbi:MAG: hypothetical protein QOK17_815 [Sphingomonadales bacterium]|jgi:hypothetical protein|nr:hypothetical protein [Sphingomonadales bacterium]